MVMNLSVSSTTLWDLCQVPGTGVGIQQVLNKDCWFFKNKNRKKWCPRGKGAYQSRNGVGLCIGDEGINTVLMFRVYQRRKDATISWSTTHNALVATCLQSSWQACKQGIIAPQFTDKEMNTLRARMIWHQSTSFPGPAGCLLLHKQCISCASIKPWWCVLGLAGMCHIRAAAQDVFISNTDI